MTIHKRGSIYQLRRRVPRRYIAIEPRSSRTDGVGSSRRSSIAMGGDGLDRVDDQLYA
jgi:hypothetical protein